MIPGELRSLINITKPTLEGWATIEKSSAQVDLILETKPLKVCEIGVFGGSSFIPMALAMQYLKTPASCIIGIDPWKNESCLEGDSDQANKDWWSNVDLEKIYKGFLAAINRLRLDPWAIIIRARSDVAVHTVPNDLDILHIDGNHSEIASVRDVRLFVPKVKQGGYIWFDDTDWVTTAAAQRILEEQCAKVTDVNKCALYQKV